MMKFRESSSNFDHQDKFQENRQSQVEVNLGQPQSQCRLEF